MRTIDHLNPIVAEEKNLPLELVEAVNKWYWNEGITKNLSQANHRSLFLPNLGTISISRYKIREQISELIQKIRRHEADPQPYREHYINVVRNNLVQLCKRRDEIAKDYVEAYGVKVRMRKLTLKDYYKDQS